MSTKKNDIIVWLEENNIPHDSSHTKAELLLTVKANKDKQMYDIDQLAHSHGHKVLRLPPYHCHLNPIELIWSQVRYHVTQHNSNANQTMSRVEELSKQAFENITADNWRSCIGYTNQIETEYIRKDEAMNHLYEKFVTPLSDSDSDEEE